jgi:two-component system nitrate/nitrite response regulator NarL
MPRPHVCLCHGSRLLSECLAAALNEFGNVDCMAVMPEDVLATSPASFGSVAIDLLLLDPTLDGDLSTQVAQRVKSLYPTCKVLLLISEHAIDRMIEFAQLGSHGCLFEGVGVADIRIAIQAVLSGQHHCSPQLANALVAQISRIDYSSEWPGQIGETKLTSREREVLELIAGQQLGNKQIARQLGLSLYTVKNHVHNIIEKLGVQDRHEAVTFARRRGLLVGERTELRKVGAIRLPR